MIKITYKNLEKEIYKKLKSELVGMTQQTLADKLDVSRPTIGKYLRILEDKGLVTEKKVGGLKFWSCTQSIDKTPGISHKLFSIIINRLFKSFAEHVDSNFNWRKFGDKVSHGFEDEHFLDTDYTLKIIQESGIINNFSINKFADVLYKIVSFVLEFFDTGVLDYPSVIETPPLIILRVRNSELLIEPSLIEAIIGIFEIRLQTLFLSKSLTMDYSINQKDNFVDLILIL